MSDKLHNRLNPYVALIKFSFSDAKVEKRFKTKEEREKYLESMADDIDSAKLFYTTRELVYSEFSWEEELKSESFSDAHAEALLFEIRRS